jgi:hypothetical protein
VCPIDVSAQRMRDKTAGKYLTRAMHFPVKENAQGVGR